VKLPPFDYRAAGSVDEAVSVLAEHGPAAAVLAGGQSLLLELRYRRHRPALLLDINPLADRLGLARDGAALRVGALVRHAALERLTGDDPLSVLLRQVARYVAHPPIRTRGTLAGSLAWAHPAAEWCAAAVALDAAVTLRGRGGERTVAAAAWFRGPLRTARQPDELVTEVRLPLLADGTGVGFAEHRRTAASFALAAAVAAVRVVDGRIASARIGLANAADVPLRAAAAEEALRGAEPTGAALDAAAEAAAAGADPVAEEHCPVGYRRQVVRVLVRRSLDQAISGADGAQQ
jgi:carbon-monoxide dehydrogenase medium subunit